MTNSHYEAINQAITHKHDVERFLFTPDNDNPIVYSDPSTWRGYSSWSLATYYAPPGSFLCAKLAIDFWYSNVYKSGLSHFLATPEDHVPEKYKTMALLLSH